MIIQKCLLLENPPKVILNCLKVIESCMPWVPSAFIYSSAWMDYIVEMASCRDYLEGVLSCLTEIYTNKVNEEVEFKVFLMKRNYLIRLMDKFTEELPENNFEHFLTLACQVIREERKFI